MEAIFHACNVFWISCTLCQDFPDSDFDISCPISWLGRTPTRSASPQHGEIDGKYERDYFAKVFADFYGSFIILESVGQLNIVEKVLDKFWDQIFFFWILGQIKSLPPHQV